MEPAIKREGNLRLVGTAIDAWPYDLGPLMAPIDQALASQEGVRALGPAQVLVALPPDDPDPTTWNLHLARACIGLPTVRSPLLVEDYHNLVAVTLPHVGPVRDLHRSFRLAADFARSQGARTRPYWRIALHQRLTPDGQAILTTEVSVFIDR